MSPGDGHRNHPMRTDLPAEDKGGGLRGALSVGDGLQVERAINAEARRQAGPPPPPCSPPPASSGTGLPHLQASVSSSVK